MHTVQVAVVPHLPGTMPLSIAILANVGTETRATAQTRPTAPPRYIILRCGLTASRMRRQPARRVTRSSLGCLLFPLFTTDSPAFEASSAYLTSTSVFGAAQSGTPGVPDSLWAVSLGGG